MCINTLHNKIKKKLINSSTIGNKLIDCVQVFWVLSLGLYVNGSLNKLFTQELIILQARHNMFISFLEGVDNIPPRNLLLQ